MDLPPPSFCLNSNPDMAVSFDEWFRPKVESLSGIVDLDSVMMKTGSIVGSSGVSGVDVLDHATQNLAEFEGFLLTERDHRSSIGIGETGGVSTSHQLEDLANSDLLLQGKEDEIQVEKVSCDGNSNKLTFLEESLELPRDILTIKEEKLASKDTPEISMEPISKKEFSVKQSSKTCDEEDLCSFNILNYQIEPSISSLEESLTNSVSIAALKVQGDMVGAANKQSQDDVMCRVDKVSKVKSTVGNVPLPTKQPVSKVTIQSDGKLVVAGDTQAEEAQVVIRNVAGEPLFQGKISELLAAAVCVSGTPNSALVQSSCATAKTTNTLKMPVKISPANSVMSFLSTNDQNLTSVHSATSARNTNDKIQSRPLCSSVKLKVGANPPEEADLEMAEEQDVEEETVDSISSNKTLRRVPEEGPVTEALAELGITTESILCTLSGVTGNTGSKLWVCHAEGCNKSFPRLSMLKIHILGHYGVRPYKEIKKKWNTNFPTKPNLEETQENVKNMDIYWNQEMEHKPCKPSPTQCDYDGCHWSFYTYFKLKRHKETHLKKKDYLCPVEGCGRRFTTIYNLHTHEKLHWRPAEMVCPVKSCGACFQTRRHLEVHLRDHDAHHAPYRCPYADCGKHYYSANSLQSHVKSHQHKEEEVRCSWEGCGKLFDKPCRLRAHMRTHTGDRPYPCLFQGCGARFSTASKLKRHQHKHTNNRRFKCGEEGCMKSFLRSEHLKEHLMKHAGVGSFHCPIQNCKVKFTAKSSLYVHLKKHKGGGLTTSNVQSGTTAAVNNQIQPLNTEKEKASLLCPVEGCNRKYVSKSNLRQHLLKAHVLGDAHPMMLMTNSIDELGIATEPIEENGSANELRNSYIVMGLPGSLEDDVPVITDSAFVQTTVAPLNDLLTARQGCEGGDGLAPSVDHLVSVISGVSVESNEETLVTSSVCIEQDGSARTSYTLHDVVRERESRRKQNRQGDDSECALAGGEESSCRTNSLRDPVLDTVVAGTSSLLGVSSKDIVLPQEPSPCPLLQDDLPGTLFRVSGSVDGAVDRDGIMSVADVDSLDVSVGGVGGQSTSHLDPHQVLVPGVLGTTGFQVLLLSPPLESPRNHDFPPESTINLRDLE